MHQQRAFRLERAKLLRILEAPLGVLKSATGIFRPVGELFWPLGRPPDKRDQRD